jgi:hypothetical protein
LVNPGVSRLSNQVQGASRVGGLAGAGSAPSRSIKEQSPAAAGLQAQAAARLGDKAGLVPTSLLGQPIIVVKGLTAAPAPTESVMLGKVQFDGAKNVRAGLDSEPAAPVTGKASKGSFLSSWLERERAVDALEEVPPFNNAPRFQVGNTGSTILDAVIVAGVGFFTRSWETAYLALIVISSIRFSPLYVSILRDDSKSAQSGYWRTAAIAMMLFAFVPGLFLYEVYKNALKPLVVNIKDAVVWTYDNIIVPVARFVKNLAIDFVKAVKELAIDFARFVRDTAKAAWELAKDLGRFVKNLAIDLAKAVKELAIDFARFVRDTAKAAWELAKDLGRFVKNLAIDFAKTVKRIVINVARAVKDAAIWTYDNVIVPVARFVRDLAIDFANAVERFATWTYENVLTPIGHAFRGVSAGVIAGIGAAVAVAVPFLTAASIYVFVKPSHSILNRMGYWPASFRVTATVLAVPFLGAAVYVSYKAILALAALTLVGSALVGFGGAAVEGVKEGYTNGFSAGVAKGFGSAVKLAASARDNARTNYSNWKLNIKESFGLDKNESRLSMRRLSVFLATD